MEKCCVNWGVRRTNWTGISVRLGVPLTASSFKDLQGVDHPCEYLVKLFCFRCSLTNHLGIRFTIQRRAQIYSHWSWEAYRHFRAASITVTPPGSSAAGPQHMLWVRTTSLLLRHESRGGQFILHHFHIPGVLDYKSDGKWDGNSWKHVGDNQVTLSIPVYFTLSWLSPWSNYPKVSKCASAIKPWSKKAGLLISQAYSTSLEFSLCHSAGSRCEKVQTAIHQSITHSSSIHLPPLVLCLPLQLSRLSFADCRIPLYQLSQNLVLHYWRCASGRPKMIGPRKVKRVVWQNMNRYYSLCPTHACFCINVLTNYRLGRAIEVHRHGKYPATSLKLKFQTFKSELDQIRRFIILVERLVGNPKLKHWVRP